MKSVLVLFQPVRVISTVPKGGVDVRVLGPLDRAAPARGWVRRRAYGPRVCWPVFSEPGATLEIGMQRPGCRHGRARSLARDDHGPAYSGLAHARCEYARYPAGLGTEALVLGTCLLLLLLLLLGCPR